MENNNNYTNAMYMDEDFEAEAYEEIINHFSKFLNVERLYRKIEPRFVYKHSVAVHIVEQINKVHPKHKIICIELPNYEGCFLIYFQEILDDCLAKL